MSIYDFIPKCAMFYFGAHAFNAFPVNFYFFKFDLIFFEMDTMSCTNQPEYP